MTRVTKPEPGMCQGSVSDRLGWKSYACGNKAKATVDGVELCGVHANQALRQKQYRQEAALERPAGQFRTASRNYLSRQDRVGKDLLAACEAGGDGREAFTLARVGLAASLQVYQDDLAGILDDIEAALVMNSEAEYPIAETAPSVREVVSLAHQVRDELDRMKQEDA